MTQPHKTLNQIKTLIDCQNEIAQQKGFETFGHAIDYAVGNSSIGTIIDISDEAAELYASQFVNPPIDIKEIDPEIGAAFNEFSKQNRRRTPNRERESQFVKKDSVSSDVEQAAKDYARTCYDSHEGTFIAGYKHCQSTQQPATINWLTDGEIEKIFQHNAHRTMSIGVFKKAVNDVQSKIKERVNYVDPHQFCIDFMMWVEENDWEISTVGAIAIPTFENRRTEQVLEWEELLQIYLAKNF